MDLLSPPVLALACPLTVALAPANSRRGYRRLKGHKFRSRVTHFLMYDATQAGNFENLNYKLARSGLPQQGVGTLEIILTTYLVAGLRGLAADNSVYASLRAFGGVRQLSDRLPMLYNLFFINIYTLLRDSDEEVNFFSTTDNLYAGSVGLVPVYFQAKYYLLSRKLRKILKGSRKFKKILKYVHPRFRINATLIQFKKFISLTSQAREWQRVLVFFLALKTRNVETPYYLLQQKQQTGILAAWTLKAKK